MTPELRATIMLEELLKFIIEDVVCSAFGGIFYRARSRKARFFKYTAIVAIVSSIVLFVVAVTIARGHMQNITGIGSIVCVVVFFCCGLLASVFNMKVN